MLVVVNEDRFIIGQVVFLHQQRVDPRVGFEQVDIAGGDAAVKQRKEIPLFDLLHGVRGNVGQVIQPIARQLQLAHRVDGVLVGFEDDLPLVDHGLYLKNASAGGCVFQHDPVGGPAGNIPPVQVLPFLTAKGQGVHDLLRLFVHKAVHQEIFGGEVDNHAAQVKDDVFIHKQSPTFHQGPTPRLRTLLTAGPAGLSFPIIHANGERNKSNCRA